MVSTLEGIKLEQEGKQVKNTFVIFATIIIITKLSLGETQVFIQVVFIVYCLISID